ncbi:MAG: ABC transporter ATP-binding protein [Candidatus Bipolaricaulia bacterium]
MAKVLLKEVTKKFGELVAVDRVDLTIDDGTFTVLVGPSGCGKTTTLRMVAGLEDITEGEIYIGERLVNGVPPKDRDIAMVFQNYALYPHMDVYSNMAFGLKLRKVPKPEIEKKVNATAELLGIEEKLRSKPKELSGGQRQRVAVGRAIVRDPAVFLFDEPLSNLDAKLRVQMRAELQELHHRLKTTTIYVTHDQVEAMTLGHGVAVMKDGIVQQFDQPQSIYDYPINQFVAGFIGSPSMNFLDTKIIREDGGIYVDGKTFKLKVPQDKVKALTDYVGQEVTFGIRPEDLILEETAQDYDEEMALETIIHVTEPLGDEIIIHAEDGGHRLIAQLDPRVQVRADQKIKLVVYMDRMHVFDKETGEAVL